MAALFHLTFVILHLKLKKINLFIAFLLLLSVVHYQLSISPVHAQSPESTSSNTVSIYNQTPPTSPLSPIYTNIMAINLIHTFSCLAEGVSVIGQPCIEYGFNGQASSGGALGGVKNFLVSMYETPPLSTTEYLADAAKSFQIIPQAQAVEGSGNAVLSPILEIWKVTRNIAYFAMIIVFIVVGFMIMFRQKINPQTVISVQAALPGLVIGLILITFSYFISALVIDTTFVTTRVAGTIFEGTVLQKGETNRILADGNLLTIFTSFLVRGEDVVQVSGATAETVKSLEGSPFGTILNTASTVTGCVITSQANAFGFLDDAIPGLGLVANCVTGGLVGLLIASIGTSTGALGTVTGFILYVVLMLALLIAMFRVFFALIVSYITLVITTIGAPFYFLFGSIPGKQGVIGTWFKTMFANALVFPAVMAAFIFAAYILGGTDMIRTVSTSSVDLSGGTVPLLGGLSSDFLKIVLAYGVLLIIPVIPDTVKGAFGVKTSPLGGAAIGAAAAGINLGKQTGEKLVSPWAKQREAYKKVKAEDDATKMVRSTQQPKWYMRF